MKLYQQHIPALQAIALHYRRGYCLTIGFTTDEEKLERKAIEWAEAFGTRLPAWRRQDRKQRGLPNAVAVAGGVLGYPGRREVILMATAEALSAPAISPWAKEKWTDRYPTFGPYILSREPRPGREPVWTWRLQESVYQGISRYLISLVKQGNAGAVRLETESWLGAYALFGGVRRQLRRSLMAARKLWNACHQSAWPGVDPDALPMLIGFRKDTSPSDKATSVSTPVRQTAKS
ncbi:hypothetical protein [Caldimonas sp. KR1-144]|uniref:hypothetical protein n=1 Tax=Caldimonas sp. KR1-144 TaxID=3400911 RepID=UPI003C025070